MPDGKLIRQSSSYMDPGGTVYESDDEILRAISAPFADFYKRLLENSPVKEMLGHQLVETELALGSIPNYALTLRHRRIWPVSYCYEWPMEMLRDAALLTLDICLRVSDHGLVLQDASPWNLVFDRTRPIFVDFTSVVPQDQKLLWVAYDQFCRLFLFPLALYRYLPGRLVRALLRDSVSGVSADETARLLPLHATVHMPWLLGRLHLARFVLAIVRALGRESDLKRISSRFQPTREARRSFFISLRKDVRKIPRRIPKSRWVGYYADIQTFFHPSQFNTKQHTVAHLLAEIKPHSVVDIGCNRGGYSILAAIAGAKVVAFDTDERSVASLYQLARENKFEILPLVMDILNPSPSLGWRSEQLPAARQRFRSEMAMALGLVHHLVITYSQTFERIVQAFADYADNCLLTEFVPLDDPRAQDLMVTVRKDLSWCSLEMYIHALRKTFSRVERFPSHPQGRTLILCYR